MIDPADLVAAFAPAGCIGAVVRAGIAAALAAAGRIGRIAVAAARLAAVQLRPEPPGSLGSRSLQPVRGRFWQLRPRPPGSPPLEIGSESEQPLCSAAASSLTSSSEPAAAPPATLARNERRLSFANPAHAHPPPCVRPRRRAATADIRSDNDRRHRKRPQVRRREQGGKRLAGTMQRGTVTQARPGRQRWRRRWRARRLKPPRLCGSAAVA